MSIRSSIIVGFLALASVHAIHAQDEAVTTKPKAILIEEVGAIDECRFRTTIDRFSSRLRETQLAEGYIINYGDRYGIAERERVITAQILLGYDQNRMVFVRGGYRREPATELWLIPMGADRPAPGFNDEAPSGIDADREPDTFLYDARGFSKRTLRGFLLNGERKSEFLPDEAPANDDPDSDIAPEYRPTPEEIESDRYGWIHLGLASRLANRETTATGIIQFYADERIYDIPRLHDFVAEARKRLAKYGRIAESRFIVVYGGYRPDPEVEFWIVRAGSAPPPLRPNERCKN